MTWTYSGDPKDSDKDKFRFLITDTDPLQPILQDEEIQYVLDTYASDNARLYRLFDAMANNFARAIKKSLGPQSEDPTARQKFFEEKAVYYRKLATASSGLSMPVSAPPIFDKGMTDNLRSARPGVNGDCDV